MTPEQSVTLLAAVDGADVDAAIEAFSNVTRAGHIGYSPGWSGLVLRLLLGLDALGRARDSVIVLEEVQEKVASMRAYFSYDMHDYALDTEIKNLLDRTEDESLARCRLCGARPRVKIAGPFPNTPLRCHRYGSAPVSEPSLSAHALLAASALPEMVGAWRPLGGRARPAYGAPVSARGFEGVARLWRGPGPTQLAVSMLTSGGAPIDSPIDEILDAEASVDRALRSALGLP